MARRTNPTMVRSVATQIASSVDLSIFIDTASKIVDKVEVCAGSELDDQQLALIETWLTAHFYSVTNPVAMSKKIGEAETRYQERTMGMGYDGTMYGQQALAIDTSGCLRKLGKQKATIKWLGSKANDHHPVPETPTVRTYEE